MGALLALSACGIPVEEDELGTDEESTEEELRAATTPEILNLAQSQAADELTAAASESDGTEAEFNEALAALQDPDSADALAVDDPSGAERADHPSPMMAPNSPVYCVHGEPRLHITGLYQAGKWVKRVPLRCGYWKSRRGGTGFGYRKLVAKRRWNIWFKGMMAVTMAMDMKPKVVRNLRTKKITGYLFRTPRFTDCPVPYRFKVLVSRARITGEPTSHNISGVQTAYQDFTE